MELVIHNIFGNDKSIMKRGSAGHACYILEKTVHILFSERTVVTILEYHFLNRFYEF